MIIHPCQLPWYLMVDRPIIYNYDSLVFNTTFHIITRLFVMLKIGYFVRKIKITMVNKSIILWIRNTKFS